MKIALFGQFGGGNSGNDGSLEAMVSYLRAAVPHAELTCFCRDPETVESAYRIKALGTGYAGLRRPLLKRLDGVSGSFVRRLLTLVYPFRQMRHMDVLIVPGTGFLDDYQEAPFGWPFMIFRWSLAAKMTGAKLAFVSIGAGPIKHPISRWFMKSAARMCHYRSYRDRHSKEFMLRNGSKVEGDGVFPDLAFRLPIAADDRDPDGQNITVGLGVMNYTGWSRNGAEGYTICRNYFSKLTTFATWLLEQGYRIRLLTGDSIDETAVQQFLHRLGPAMSDTRRERISVEPTRSLHELMRQIGMTDIVVGTRFHNIVCAMKMQRPVISLSYAAKNEALLADTGLHGFSQHVETFDLEVLKRQFAKALASRDEIRKLIANGMGRFETRLAEQDRELFDRVLAKAGQCGLARLQTSDKATASIEAGCDP